METITTKPETVQEEKELASVPEEIEADEKRALTVRGQWLHDLALQGVNKVQEFMRAVETLQRAALQATYPNHWVLYRDREGNVTGVPSAAACGTIRKWLGISIVDVADPVVYHEKGAGGQEVTVVEQTANGFCALNQETVEKITFAVRSDDDFVGRSIPGDKETRRLQDLKASCRTGLDNKATRILSGLGKVPSEKLKENGLDIERCVKGRGYGTSSEREASKVADEGVKESAKKLGEEILRRVGGDREAARDLLVDVTKSDGGNGKKAFAGWRSIERLTKQWQVDGAWERLKKHPEFGDDVREPGGDDDKEANGRMF